ncbi:MAG: DegV family protein [Anaerolineales bacterium]|nr:DegV family protein [Anaerolineales bacterium]
MTIRIVTDSTCDLPQKAVREYGIGVVPLYIQAGGRSYLDGVDLSRAEFYERLPSFQPAATTAVPSPELFRREYERLAAEGATEILSIHISEKLSGMVNVAREAAKETTALPVTVFDSRQLSLGMGFEVLRAAELAAQGRTMAEILAELEKQIARTHVFAALDTLEFLRRSGRMNFALATIGTILQVKPFLKMYDGEPTAERVRTRSGAMKRLIELLLEHGPFEKAAILQSAASERAKELLDEVRNLLPSGEIWMEEINPVIGTHIGPGVIGFACISKA